MGKFICRIEGPKCPLYFDWSQHVDAPVSYGMPLGEFIRYYRSEYGAEGMRGLVDRLRRCDQKGTSSRLHDSLDEVIKGNHAGEDGATLSKEAFIEYVIHGLSSEPLLPITLSDRGFEYIHTPHRDDPTQSARLVSQSSGIELAVRDEDVPDNPGSSFLWIGDFHRLDRDQVEELVGYLSNWLDCGYLRDERMLEHLHKEAAKR